MRLRFQADADLNQNTLHAVIRRAPTLDFQTARAAGLTGLPNLEMLTLAACEGRLVVTHDRKTMPRHFAALICRSIPIFLPHDTAMLIETARQGPRVR